MSHHSVWAAKVAHLIQNGNGSAALAQIKVAPTVKDLQELRKLLNASQQLARFRDVEQTIADQIVTLSSSRLHRSP